MRQISRFCVLILFVLLVDISNVNSNAIGNTLIVGGSAILIKDAPYQASLRISGTHICGATIISPNFVLTTADCIYTYAISSFSLRVGSTYYGSGGSLVYVRNKIIHPNYNRNNFDYDFGLLELEKPLIFNENISAIRLPQQDEPILDSTFCKVTGWGETQNSSELKNHLRVIYVPIVNQMACNSLYGVQGLVTDRMLCAGFINGGRDACQGDSGGALARNGIAYGIVSWGYGCALPNYPGVYSRTASVADWIRANTDL